MPFTATHPAAVLGLLSLGPRLGLPASALVIGSMAPDLPQMLPWPEVVHFAHTPPGLLTLDLALGVMAFLAWQRFYRPAAIVIAPTALRARLPPVLHFGRWPLAIAAVLIGAATHLVWDSFTHDWMWGTKHVPWLAQRHGALWGYEWARWISEVVGLAVIAGWCALWWRRTPRRAGVTALRPREQVLAWLAVLAPAVLGFVIGRSRGSGYLAITHAAALGLVGFTALATLRWILSRRGRNFRRSGGA